ncbi:DEAD/DEAH box helicase family protein [Helicobacter himalayensis]|uniref:DEAD/DEAH box helicase family protein n=1 Tax=Helicobacter himalayensis TaxID=1591088 RepID=UPI003D6DEF38
MSKLNLSEKLKTKLEGEEIEIPSYIQDNLSKELREYQKEALRHYLKQRELHNKGISGYEGNHLMFHMATGSGKTLIMAALMLDLYVRGYREFVFFVNSKAIIEKTRANFCERGSAKYLFSQEIVIDTKRVEVKSALEFSKCDDNAIHIVFSTIQGLHSLLNDEKENSLTFGDLAGRKVVYIADEAHHLNADTKKSLSKSEKEIKQGWEGTIAKAFASNAENLLLEFTATIPQQESVLGKYRDKLVHEYTLKEFYANGYSKKIFLLKYNSLETRELFLGACVLSLYRQLVGLDYGIELKPVILFKSGTIPKSKANEETFYHFVEAVDSREIEEFFVSIDEGDSKRSEELLVRAKGYFKARYKETYAKKLSEHIKEGFSKSYCVNMNELNALEVKVVNTLESKDNFTRVIFAVDKLNEGWDVLNLFDIVRLDNTKENKDTTKNAQLIGRGARYYPFAFKEGYAVDKRKFDRERHDLDVLEALSYHSFNDSAYISSLQKELEQQGTPAEDKRILHKLKAQPNAIEIARSLKNSAKDTSPEILSLPIATNSIREIKESGDLFNARIVGEIKQMAMLEMPLFNNREKTQEEAYKKQDEGEGVESEYKAQGLKCIAKEVFLKAMNKGALEFSVLKNLREVGSKEDFIKCYLYPLSVKFHKKQSFDREAQLQMALFIVKNLHKILKAKPPLRYEIEDFKQGNFTLQEREIWSKEEKLESKKYEWLVYDKYKLDSTYEVEFLRDIDSLRDKISAKYEKWCIIRNECFSELKLYDYCDSDDPKNARNIRGFFPDFVFWGIRRDKREVVFECFMEAKGEHLGSTKAGVDAWKEEFLKKLKKKVSADGKKLEIGWEIALRGLGFFTLEARAEFAKEFEKVVLGDELI